MKEKQALGDWLDEQKKLCNSEDIVPFSVQESRRLREIESNMPKAIAIIEAWRSKAARGFLTVFDMTDIAVDIINEKP